MKLQSSLSAIGAHRLTSYITGERIGSHGAVAEAVGKACRSLLPFVDHEKYPTTHQTIETIGHIAGIAAIGARASTEIAQALRNPESLENQPVVDENSVPLDDEVMRAIGVKDAAAALLFIVPAD